jgi:hypothetical protein
VRWKVGLQFSHFKGEEHDGIFMLWLCYSMVGRSDMRGRVLLCSYFLDEEYDRVAS